MSREKPSEERDSLRFLRAGGCAIDEKGGGGTGVGKQERKGKREMREKTTERDRKREKKQDRVTWIETSMSIKKNQQGENKNMRVWENFWKSW